MYFRGLSVFNTSAMRDAQGSVIVILWSVAIFLIYFFTAFMRTRRSKIAAVILSAVFMTFSLIYNGVTAAMNLYSPAMALSYIFEIVIAVFYLVSCFTKGRPVVFGIIALAGGVLCEVIYFIPNWYALVHYYTIGNWLFLLSNLTVVLMLGFGLLFGPSYKQLKEEKAEAPAYVPANENDWGNGSF